MSDYRKAENTSGASDLLLVLGIVFACFKLAGLIDWSWWIVLLPIYAIPVALLLLLMAVTAAAYAFLAVCTAIATIRSRWSDTELAKTHLTGTGELRGKNPPPRHPAPPPPTPPPKQAKAV